MRYKENPQFLSLDNSYNYVELVAQVEPKLLTEKVQRFLADGYVIFKGIYICLVIYVFYIMARNEITPFLEKRWAGNQNKEKGNSEKVQETDSKK